MTRKHHTPSLRAERSNLPNQAPVQRSGDCFAPLAMTGTVGSSLPPCFRSMWLSFCLALWLTSSFADESTATAQTVDPALRAALYQAVRETNSFEDRFDAEVWLMDMSNRLESRIADSQERLELLRILHEEATNARLPPELVLAVIQVESNFDRFAISSVGARGFMQVMPFWVDEIGRPEDNLLEARTNLRYGCTILRHYLDREKQALGPALARYNGSVGKRRYPDLVYSALDKRWYRR